MSEVVIKVRATHRQIRQAVREAVEMAKNGAGASSRALLIRMGLAAQARIRDAFVTKSRGGTDEAGDHWPKLSPTTIAYRRKHPGLKPPKQRAEMRPSGGLSARERKRWWEVYSQKLAAFKGDKAHAAAAAWVILKNEGAQTILDKYGHVNVNILWDTGVLLNSISPGADPTAGLTSPPHIKEQVFDLERGAVIIGTTRGGVSKHHQGTVPHVPQRRLWPDIAKWPRSWWRDICEQGKLGIVDIILNKLRRL